MTTPAYEPERGHGSDAVPPLVHLDDPRSFDPWLVGGKAALLSRGRAGGLPVLAGVVVTAPTSQTYLEKGVAALERRGSGGARLEVSMSGLDETLASRLQAEVAALGEVLVVRSSSVLEMSSEWSGAFTSYLDIHPDEVGRAVTGCWASAFTVAALERFEAAGLAPGSSPMAVLIQPALEPDYGGTARLEGDDVVVTAVAGSPAPLVQGWEPGTQARVGPDGHGRGESALDLMGGALIEAVADVLRQASDMMGTRACEWAIVDGEVILLQLLPGPTASPPPITVQDLADTPAGELARLVRRHPGPLGESLVLPWALGARGGLPEVADPLPLDPADALREAEEHSSRLTAQVWSRPRPEAARLAARALSILRGPEPQRVWEEIALLRPPDPEEAIHVLRCLATVREAAAHAGAVTWETSAWYLDVEHLREILAGAPVSKRPRIGYDRWEPFTAAAVISERRSARGTGSAPGIGCGRLRWISSPEQMAQFRPREVVVAPYPTPNLAPLLWDAAGVVTTGGGPAAHLFESARALAIPAVSAIHLDEVLGMSPGKANREFALAVDGSAGAVYISEW